MVRKFNYVPTNERQPTIQRTNEPTNSHPLQLTLANFATEADDRLVCKTHLMENFARAGGKYAGDDRYKKSAARAVGTTVGVAPSMSGRRELSSEPAPPAEASELTSFFSKYQKVDEASIASAEAARSVATPGLVGVADAGIGAGPGGALNADNDTQRESFGAPHSPAHSTESGPGSEVGRLPVPRLRSSPKAATSASNVTSPSAASGSSGGGEEVMSVMSIKEIKRMYAEQAKAKKKSSADDDEEMLNEAAARRDDEPPLTELEKEMRRRKVPNNKH